MERLTIVELLDDRDRVTQRIRVTRSPFTVGRGLDNDVILDDPHADPRHATITVGTQPDGSGRIEDLGSRNGTEVNGRRIETGVAVEVSAGDALRVGSTRLRLGAPFQEPEQALPLGERVLPRIPERVPVALGLAAFAVAASVLTVYLDWYETDALLGLAGAGIGIVVLLFMWAGVWAIGNRLFVGRFNFWPHLAIASATAVLSAITLRVNGLLDFAAPGWFTSWVIGLLLVVGPSVVALLAHVDVSSGRSPRFKLVVTAAVSAVFAALALFGSLVAPTDHVRASLGQIPPLPTSLLIDRSVEDFTDDLSELERSIAVKDADEGGNQVPPADEAPGDAPPPVTTNE